MGYILMRKKYKKSSKRGFTKAQKCGIMVPIFNKTEELI